MPPLGFTIVDQISEAAMLDGQVINIINTTASIYNVIIITATTIYNVINREVKIVRNGSDNVKTSP